jgi:hypothetical protein
MSRPALVSVLGLATHSAPQAVHHRFAIGFLIETDANHEHFAGKAELGTGKCQGAAPLAGTGLGGEAFDAEDLVVVCLRNGVLGLWLPGGLTPSFL